jgi:RNA polymerase sigma-70 factor, ECF subfamily
MACASASLGISRTRRTFPALRSSLDAKRPLGRRGRVEPVRERLIERARAGDDVAFAELVDIDGDRCYAIAYRILRDAERAQDAVQQAFLLAWRELPRLRDASRFEVWLHRLVVNACYEEFRRYRRWRANVRALPVDGPAGPDQTVSVDERDALERAFQRLSPEHRAVVVLHHHAGVPLAAIAEIAGVPLGTVKSRLHYATRILRDALAADRVEGRKVRPA